MSLSESLDFSKKVLDFISKRELNDEEIEWVAKETLEGFKDNYNPGFLEYRKSVSTDYAAVEWEDSGTGFVDIYGNRFLDCLGGYGIYNVGHRHPKVLKAVKDQLNRQALHSQELLDPLRAMLAKLVAMITPGELNFSFFTNSGTESVEGALKLAKLHTGHPGIISTVGAFHGKSQGSLSTTAKAVFREPYLPLMPGVQHVPYGDAETMRKVIHSSFAVGNKIAAVILEPIQGEGGVIIPPDNYFKEVREICDEFEVLLIADEVQTGMGRTGKMFGMEHYNVVPDIMCLAKAFGGGVMPIGAFVSTKEIFEKMTPNPFLHTTTFGGNPVACAAAIAAINVIIEEKLVEQSREKGDYFLPKFKEIAEKHPLMKEVRGKGLLIGLEFIDDETGFEVAKGLFDNGILVAGTLINAKTIRIEPTLTISYNEMDYVLETLNKVLNKASKSSAAAARGSKILKFEAHKCIGCKLCHLACSAHNEKVFSPSLGRLKITSEYTRTGLEVKGQTCDLCLECVNACPTSAIIFRNGRLAFDESICTDCKICVDICPHNVIVKKDRGVGVCVQCMSCVSWCPTRALTSEEVTS